ncbi:aquaporin-11 [Tiliqua scincoides]|uniref:aquaporin-11 n=1 Tax=Tiliqua scincoides TaxID=71010 RepID=UPI00346273B8
MLVSACFRKLTRQLAARRPNTQGFFLELTGAFQIGACTHELLLLAGLPPRPHVALALTYVCTALHGWTLSDSVNNPASSFHLLFRGRIVVRAWWLQLSAQFTGAMLAKMYIKLIWLLGMTARHSRALVQTCSSPLQTTVVHAFILELLFSFLFHLTLLQFEAMSHKTKVHLAALLITTLVYAGGHLTGAIFNPALALSLHTSCFLDKFWNYVLVYWIAPCLGSVLVVVLWDDVLPLMRARV